MTSFTQEQLDTVSAKIKHLQFGMFTTTDATGALSSRPLTQQQVDADGQLWFFTSDQSPFTHELAAHPQVNISFANPNDSLYLSVSGRAELLKDRNKAEQLWNPTVQAWFPGGLDDPHLALIKVSMESAEYWDAQAGKLTQLFAIAKAAFTGERPQHIGEHEKINL